MNLESSIKNLKNNYLEIGKFFEENNIKGKIIEKKSFSQFKLANNESFIKSEKDYKLNNVDEAWIKRGDICYRIIRID